MQRIKSNRKKQKQQHVIVTENNFLKLLLQNLFEIMARSSMASLIVPSHGIPYSIEDSWLVDPQRHLPSLSSLLDSFRSMIPLFHKIFNKHCSTKRLFFILSFIHLKRIFQAVYQLNIFIVKNVINNNKLLSPIFFILISFQKFL